MASKLKTPSMPLLIMTNGMSLGTREEGFSITVYINPFYANATDEQIYLAFTKSYGDDLVEIRDFQKVEDLQYTALIILKE